MGTEESEAWEACLGRSDGEFYHMHMLPRRPAPGTVVTAQAPCGEQGTFEVLPLNHKLKPCPDCLRRIREG